MSLLNLIPNITLQNETEKGGTFVVEPLMAGFGQTLGNALRRVLLSHLSGSAVTQVRIDGVSHEFSTIPGVKEDVVQLLLNLKQIRFTMHSDEPQTVKLDAKGPGQITAADLKLPSGLEVNNPELVLATLADTKTKLSLELTIEKGYGYRVAPEQNLPIGVIGLDAKFSPITRVNYTVEDTRVGQNTNLDKLTLLIETDGSISAKDAITKASSVLVEAFGYLDGSRSMDPAEAKAAAPKARPSAGLDGSTSLEELGISTRVLNSLKKAGIETVEDLRSKDRSELLSIKNLGEKSLDEVLEKIG